MKVLTISTCDDRDRNILSKIINPFLEGVASAGAEVSHKSSRDLFLFPCRGCTTDYQFESPGYCYCEDDMNKLYPEFRESDVWVFATCTKKTKPHEILTNILDRMEPLFDPFDKFNNDENASVKEGKVVLIAITDEWDLDSFNLLTDQMKDISLMFNREFAGAILRSHAIAMDIAENPRFELNKIFDAVRNLGCQVARNENLSVCDLATVSQMILEKDEYKQALEYVSL